MKAKYPRMDVEEQNDLVELLTALFYEHGARQLDTVVAQVKVRMALIAAGEGVTVSGKEATQAA